MNVAQPALVLDVHEAIQQWEPRVRVDRVHVYDSGLDKKRLDIICTVLASAAQISVKIDL
jgi:phage baseplate assembly protein W